MSLRFSSQQPPGVYVKHNPPVNRTRHETLVVFAKLAGQAFFVNLRIPTLFNVLNITLPEIQPQSSERTLNS